MMSAKIREALSKLDVNNGNHWTADGLPRLDTVKMLAGNPTITREQISAVAPEFKRTGTAAPSAVTQQGPSAGTGGTPIAAPAAATGPAVAPPADPVAAQQPQGSHEVAKLEADLEDAEKHLEHLHSAEAEVKREISATAQRADKIRTRLEALKPKNSTGNQIQNYLASQRKTLEDRAARQRLIRESGLDLRELTRNLKAPVDAIRARQTRRS